MKKGWTTKVLGDVATVGAGNSAPQDEELFEAGTIPFFRTADAGRVRFGDIIESQDYLNERGAVGMRRFPKGTILFPKSGASTFLNHRVILGANGCVSSHLATIVADENQAHSRFLLYFLSTVQSQDLVQDHAYPSLNLPTIAGIQVQLPSLVEQKRIVGVLDEVFAGLAVAKANAEKNLKNARAIFQSRLQEIFSQRETGVRRGWELKRLPEIAKYFIGLTYSPKDVTDRGRVVLRSSNIQNDEIDLTDIVRVSSPVDEDLKVRKGDILMCSRNGSKRLVGKTAMIGNLPEEMTFGTFMMIIRSIHNPFLAWFFKSEAFREQIGVGENTMINQITKYMLDAISVLLPSLTEQQQITRELQALYVVTQRLAKIYEQRQAALTELKKSLLHQAFSGEL
jgi:type I restriction enzyme S subunit